MGQCSSSNKKPAPGQQGPPRDSEESLEEHCEELAPNAPRRRGVVDDSAAPRAPVKDEASLQAPEPRPQLEDYKLAAVRGSVDDSTCAALLALRLGRGSSVNGLVKEGRSSDASDGVGSYSRASGGSFDSKQTGKADPHGNMHLDPLPENESVQLASKTVGSNADGCGGEAPADPAAQRGADTSTQHDNNPSQGSLQVGAGGAGRDEAKAGAHGPGRADAAAKKRPVEAAGDIFEAELGLTPNSLTIAVTGAAPKVPARA